LLSDSVTPDIVNPAAGACCDGAAQAIRATQSIRSGNNTTLTMQGCR